MAIIPVPSMTPVPHFPALSERATGTYNASAYAFGTHMAVTFNGELLAVASNVLGNALDAQASALAASLSASTALDAKAAAFNAANFKGNWASLAGALNIPASVRHNGRIWLLVANLADVTAAQPGVSAGWVAMDSALALIHVATATATASAGNHYSMEFDGATTLTLPASPLDGDIVWVTVSNGRTDNVLARNGQTIMGLAEDMTLNKVTSYQLRFITNTWRLL